MTLVVAGRLGDGPRVVGDTLLTMSRSGTTSPLLGGLIKVVILHPNLAVGFAGDADAALDWIASLGVRPDVPYSRDEVLSSAHNATDRKDFHLLIAECQPARVVRVSRGVIEDRGDSWGWIGDQSAFAAYQRAFADLREVRDQSSREFGAAAEGGSMVRALESVINAEDHPSVGGFAVACFPIGGGFCYSCSFRATAGGSQSIPSGVSTPLQFGQGAAAGSYSEAILAPTRPGVGLLGIHIREIRRGVLFWPARFRQPIDYLNCDQAEFSARVQADYGVEISAPVLG